MFMCTHLLSCDIVSMQKVANNTFSKTFVLLVTLEVMKGKRKQHGIMNKPYLKQ